MVKYLYPGKFKYTMVSFRENLKLIYLYKIIKLMACVGSLYTVVHCSSTLNTPLNLIPELRASYIIYFLKPYFSVGTNIILLLLGKPLK